MGARNYWHMLANNHRLHYKDKRLVQVGVPLRVPKMQKIVCCVYGMHASINPWAAWRAGHNLPHFGHHGPRFLCRVNLSGKRDPDIDKIAAEERVVLDYVDMYKQYEQFQRGVLQRQLSSRRYVKGDERFRYIPEELHQLIRSGQPVLNSEFRYLVGIIEETGAILDSAYAEYRTVRGIKAKAALDRKYVSARELCGLAKILLRSSSLVDPFSKAQVYTRLADPSLHPFKFASELARNGTRAVPPLGLERRLIQETYKSLCSAYPFPRACKPPAIKYGDEQLKALRKELDPNGVALKILTGGRVG